MASIQRLFGFVSLCLLFSVSTAFGLGGEISHSQVHRPLYHDVLVHKGVQEAAEFVALHVNEQKFKGSPFKLQTTLSAQVALGINYNISLIVDGSPVQLSLIDGFQWKSIRIPSRSWGPDDGTDIVQSSVTSSMRDVDLLRFSDIRLRGPLELKLDVPENHAVRLKLPREIDLVGAEAIKQVTLADQVEVSIKGAQEVSVGPLTVNLDLKQPQEKAVSKFREALRKGQERQITIREPSEVVSLNSEERFKVKRIGASSVDIRKTAGSGSTDLAVDSTDPVLKAMMSEQVISSIQTSLQQVRRDDGRKLSKLRVTKIVKASAKPILGYRLHVELAERKDEPQVSEWEALLVRTMDGYSMANLARINDPSVIQLATTYAQWLFVPNGTSVHPPSGWFPSIGPSVVM